jgi:hypothetical protein
MTKPKFPDLVYLVSKLYEGINRQDYAELAMGIVPQIREELRSYRPQISSKTDKVGYDATLESVMRQLDELEKYYQNFHHNKPRINKTAAQKISRITP